MPSGPLCNFTSQLYIDIFISLYASFLYSVTNLCIHVFVEVRDTNFFTSMMDGWYWDGTVISGWCEVYRLYTIEHPYIANETFSFDL